MLLPCHIFLPHESNGSNPSVVITWVRLYTFDTPCHSTYNAQKLLLVAVFRPGNVPVWILRDVSTPKSTFKFHVVAFSVSFPYPSPCNLALHLCRSLFSDPNVDGDVGFSASEFHADLKLERLAVALELL